MTKEAFLLDLRRKLNYLPEDEAERSLAFYAESIDDRMEDGMSEEEAVAALGRTDDIVREIEGSLPLGAIVKARLRGTGGSSWFILFTILGSPLWLPLLAAFGVIVFSVLLIVWILILCLYSVPVALLLTAVSLLVYAGSSVGAEKIGDLMMVAGMALIMGGGGLALISPLTQLVKKLLALTKSFGRSVKRLFLKGGRKA